MDGGKSVPKGGGRGGRLYEVIKMQREKGTSDFSVFTTELPPYLTAGHRFTQITTGLSNMMSQRCMRRRKKREEKEKQGIIQLLLLSSQSPPLHLQRKPRPLIWNNKQKRV